MWWYRMPEVSKLSVAAIPKIWGVYLDTYQMPVSMKRFYMIALVSQKSNS